MPSIETRQLFDGHALRGPARIEIEGDRVASVALLEDLPGDGGHDAAVRGGVDRVVCAFAMPGLVDSHVHVSGYAEGGPTGHPFEPMKSFLRLCGLTGVTAVRDLGNNLETLAYVREWSALYDGPRVFGAGPLLDAPPLRWSFSRLVRDGDEARRQVELLAIEGVDWIKAYRGIEPAVLRAITAAADAHELPVAIDCGASTALESAAAGVRSIEHAVNLRAREPGEEVRNAIDEARAWQRTDLDAAPYGELAALLRERGTFVCPTLLVSRRHCLLEDIINDPFVDYAVPVMPYHRHFKRMRTSMGMRMGRRYVRQYLGIPELARDERDEIVAGLDRMAELVARLHGERVKVVAGTDSPNPSLAPGFSLHEEIGAMVEAGLSPSAALESATGTAGELLGDPDLGVLREGAHADVLCLDGDPLSDIGALGEIQQVFMRGVALDRGAMRRKVQDAIDAVEVLA